ncbi:MAG: cyclic nucleotide-binding domain-containing protein [Elusimicrobia bacterium]|nr:cyclic nucleotide-binding domain-containing protein [Elusimicrobiota bacterium]
MKSISLGLSDYAALAQRLRGIDFFQPLTIGQLETVLPYIMLYQCNDGELIFKQGAAGDAFYVVHEGAVELRVKSGFFSFAKTIRSLGPGDFFGEMALLNKEPRTASVYCKGTTKLFVLLAADFQFIVAKNPEFAQEMTKVAERRKFYAAHNH